MILAIDNIPVANKPFGDVLTLIGGKPGTIIHLVVWRAGQKISVELARTTRDKIQH
jgi:C-terminal processing protease CtpA/Prc